MKAVFYIIFLLFGLFVLTVSVGFLLPLCIKPDIIESQSLLRLLSHIPKNTAISSFFFVFTAILGISSVIVGVYIFAYDLTLPKRRKDALEKIAMAPDLSEIEKGSRMAVVFIISGIGNSPPLQSLENEGIITPFFEDIITLLFIEVMKRWNEPEILYDCAQAIANMSTADLVEETIEEDEHLDSENRMNDDELQNLLDLLRAIGEISGKQIPEEDEPEEDGE